MLRVYPPTSVADYGAHEVPPEAVSAGGGGTVTSITATAPVVVTPTPLTGVGVVSASTMVASGGSHARGVTPDTPATAGFVKFLREDATWASPNSASINIDQVFGRDRLRYMLGANGGAGTAFIGAWTLPGSSTTQVPDFSTNWLSLGKSIGISSGAAGNACEWRINSSEYALSSTNALFGGFYFYTRCGVFTTQATARSFYGMAPVAAFANANPSTFINCVGFGNDSADTNMQIMQNDGSGTCTKTDLGASFPAQSSQTDFYEMILFAAAGQTTNVDYAIRHVFTGAIASGSLGSNLPTANTLIGAHLWVNNGTTAAAVALGVTTCYVQSDW